MEIEVDIINPNHWSSRGRRIPPCSRNRLFCWWNTPGANLPCPATQLKPWGLIAVVYHQVLPLFSVFTLSGWWFGTYIGNNDPNWRMFFRGVETTNQIFFIGSIPNLCWIVAAHQGLNKPVGLSVSNTSYFYFPLVGVLTWCPLVINWFDDPIDYSIIYLQHNSNRYISWCPGFCLLAYVDLVNIH